MEMKNITLAVDDEVLAAVRKLAAERNTTVNGLVRDYLTSLAEQVRKEAGARARKELVRLSEESTAGMAVGNGIGKTFMTVPCFLDTNILIYAASKDDPRKRKIASSLIDGGEFGISGQVLAEFYATSTRKMRPPMTARSGTSLGRSPLPSSIAWRWTPISSGQGSKFRRRYGISYWDGAIVAAAEVAGAPIVYTEDLNHGQVYGNVTAINPFIESAGSFHEEQAQPFAGAG